MLILSDFKMFLLILMRRYTVNEVLSLLENGDEIEEFSSANIYINPPHLNALSDEDSGPEDGDGLIENLSGAQLSSEAELVIRTATGDNVVRVGEADSDDADEEEEAEVEVSEQCKRKAVPLLRKWIHKDIEASNLEWNAQRPKFLNMDMTPTGFFEFFWDDQVVEYVAEMTNMNARKKGKPEFSVTGDEIRATIAILLLSGYVTLPSRRMYWSNDEDIHNAAVCSMMSLNRFEEILRFLHFADNDSLPPNDKFAKVRPLYAMMNEKFLQFWPMEQDLDVDESMIPYYGRHSTKQFIRGKPIRFGFKVWCLNTRLGYLVQCEPYQGKGTSLDGDVGLGGSVVLDLISELPPLNYCLYFDNYFTSLRLLQKLKDKGIAATGTIRANRIEKCPLASVEVMKKKERGSYDARLDKNSDIVLVRWNDNSVVTLGSNAFGVGPLGAAKRWSVAQRRQVFIEQPHLISKYNNGMGGTDRMDQNIHQYRIAIRCRRWYWQLFAFLLDVAVQNAWQLHRISSTNEKLSQLEFRRAIVMTYVRKYHSRPDPGRPVGRNLLIDKRVSQDVRFDGKDHFVGSSATQRRCGQCGLKTTKVCSKCTIPLHTACFRAFHSKN
jgi:hypothetical protein